MLAKAGESDRAIRVKKVRKLHSIWQCADIGRDSPSTCLQVNAEWARRTDVEIYFCYMVLHKVYMVEVETKHSFKFTPRVIHGLDICPEQRRYRR